MAYSIEGAKQDSGFHGSPSNLQFSPYTSSRTHGILSSSCCRQPVGFPSGLRSFPPLPFLQGAGIIMPDKQLEPLCMALDTSE